MHTSEIAAQQPAWRGQISELQERARRAFLAQDVDGLRLILSDDFTVNAAAGRVFKKSVALGLLRRGAFRDFTYEERVEIMTRHGDLVVVMGHDVVTDTADGPPRQRRFTNVWYETGGSWQLVARHAHYLAGP